MDLLRVNTVPLKASMADLPRVSTTLLSNRYDSNYSVDEQIINATRRWATSKDLPPCNKHPKRRTADA